MPSLSAGTRLGPYEIVSLLGAGGMGEVYRARDPRLGREVALKVLPASFTADPDRLRRFEQEARAAGALNHPGIVSVFDSGVHDGIPYVVSELLEGETLRERLASGPMPARKAVDAARQVAHGLAAAHEKGIVHRDLKPENLFVVKDGRVKILDFGLAKLAAPEGRLASGSGSDSQSPTQALGTEPGTVMGTVGYMSPEQVRGQSVDHRSDIFSFGAIFYEMLAGRRAFQGQSGVETMHAILKDDPPEIPQIANQPADLERVVRHCLEKDPAARFQSARDLAFHLEALADRSGQSTAQRLVPNAAESNRWRWRAIVASAVGGALLAGGFAVLWSRWRTAAIAVPIYHRITFRPGNVHNARFAPDGQDIVYSAAWEGKPPEVFLARQGSTESRPLGYGEAEILSISPAGDLALLLRYSGASGTGTLARAPLSGGAPREVFEKVRDAAWAPDGSLAVVTHSEGKDSIEFPAGKKIYESGDMIRSLRVSPEGGRFAFVERIGLEDTVVVLDTNGDRRALWTGGFTNSLAWAPEGKEIWFTASEGVRPPALRVVSLKGEQRLIAELPGELRVQDISADGRVLLTHSSWRGGVLCLSPGEIKEHDLGWLDSSIAVDLSADGKMVLLRESRQGGGKLGSVFLRPADGSAAVRLGDGYAESLSPDGKFVLAFEAQTSPRRMLLPVGAGTPRVLPSGGVVPVFGACWLPNGKRIYFVGRAPGKGPRIYLQDVENGSLRAITPEGFGMRRHLETPDGKFVVGAKAGGKNFLVPVDPSADPIDGSELQPMTALDPEDMPLAWSADGHSLYVTRDEKGPRKVDRLDLRTNRREAWNTLAPLDLTGIEGIWPILITPDGKSYAYSYHRVLSDLYVVEGLH